MRSRTGYLRASNSYRSPKRARHRDATVSWSRGACLWRTPATDLSRRRIDGRHLLTVLRQPVDERGNPWFGLLHSLGAFALVAALVWITLDAGPRVPAGVPRQA